MLRPLTNWSTPCSATSRSISDKKRNNSSVPRRRSCQKKSGIQRGSLYVPETRSSRLPPKTPLDARIVRRALYTVASATPFVIIEMICIRWRITTCRLARRADGCSRCCGTGSTPLHLGHSPLSPRSRSRRRRRCGDCSRARPRRSGPRRRSQPPRASQSRHIVQRPMKLVRFFPIGVNLPDGSQSCTDPSPAHRPLPAAVPGTRLPAVSVALPPRDASAGEKEARSSEGAWLGRWPGSCT